MRKYHVMCECTPCKRLFMVYLDEEKVSERDLVAGKLPEVIRCPYCTRKKVHPMEFTLRDMVLLVSEA